ncbi:DUF4013 domain-containing protein [Methanobacterium petrolearium]|uniref:DUF4013 domain-containing protein n=1 Tax=Methanobacterium petrolearium TaxID=710190 RepID=UPI003081FA11|nr:hypothetical protein GCM10025861_08920 [Methanobacterium petrolearium]
MDLNTPSIIEEFPYLVILAVVIFLSLVEVGYGFRIVEETVKGSHKPPSFHHPWDLFWHGVKESIILLIYFVIPLILVVMGIYEFELFFGLDFSFLTMGCYLVIGIIFFLFFNVMFQGAVLNMAHHGGSIASGFDIPSIFRKIRMVKLKNMLFISFITIITLYIVKQAIFDTLHALPYMLPYINISVGDVVSTVIVAPFLTIFTARLLGLIDVEDNLN